MKRHFEDLQLGSIELFCLAAEAGSFTAAAQLAGVTPAAVSRSIFRLEERLGSRLFVRTTRSIRLTEAGKTYFEQCRQALTQLVEAQQEMMGAQSVPSGQLRISLPTTYGHHRILPLLPAFRALYPQVSVDLHLSNRNIDFVAEGYDLAIRVRAQPDSSMIARLLEDAKLVVVASPDYLRKVGTPQVLEDLDEHECIQFELPSSGRRISLVVQCRRQGKGGVRRRGLLLFGRCAWWRDTGQAWCRFVPDLQIHRRTGARQRAVGGGACAFRGSLTSVYLALSSRPVRTAAGACFCGFFAAVPGAVGRGLRGKNYR